MPPIVQLGQVMLCPWKEKQSPGAPTCHQCSAARMEEGGWETSPHELVEGHLLLTVQAKPGWTHDQSHEGLFPKLAGGGCLCLDSSAG